MKLPAALTLALAATPALADWERVEAEGSVSEVTDRLEAAVVEAGATVFARVNHAEGAVSVEMDLPDAELLIFGNPRLGTSAMQQDIRAGVVLPLRVLVADVEGQTVLIYEEVEEMFDDTDVDDDAEFVEAMEDALETLTERAARD
ncbi:DUF302 domain-containing protein [Histidinibacterium lentulum]|uniref:DUF302 domain-containing protein n=1 Tax=Histidinibacterium lentulum TaxID=2480588 RepID=A0A3N2QYD8_9RHOB|nr:DUF302 domain-containing protein [Histidinibacterium lentulum]ROU00217.1 DUF302 domain-containing protein [Histidinibacterium lentulum]